jgi:peptide/nickel transport system substrate-binding protein
MSTSSPRSFLIAAGAALTLLGCREGDRTRAAEASASGDIGGTVVIATSAEADLLLPPLVELIDGKKAVDLLFDQLAGIGPDLNTIGDRGFVPQLAERWTWAADSLSIAFHLNPKARWHDGVPVRANDVRFTYALYTDPAVGSPHAPSVADIDSVTARDSLTAVVWFKRRFPEQFFQAVYQMSIVPEHLLASEPRASLRTSRFARQPVGSGRFRFARWVPGQTLELVADTANYRGRPKLDRVMWSIAPDYTAATTKLFAGEADFFETMRPEQLPQLARNAALKAVPRPALETGYMQLNLRDSKARSRPHPVFGERAVRRALTMAIDRGSLVRSVFDSLAYPSLGPLVRAQASADTTLPQIPFDLAAARAALDSAGWRDGDGDGVREKDGRRLSFGLIVPTSSRNRMRMAVLLQEQLKQAGAQVNLEQMEINAFMTRLTQRDFDAAMGAFIWDPSPGVVRQVWSGDAARAKGGANYGHYVNASFDAAVDSAIIEEDPARSKAHYRRAYEVILADAPAVWLYELRQIAAAHKRIQLAGVRADAWWAGIAGWSIPADQRIARDRIGLRAAPTAAPAGAGTGTTASVVGATGSR